MTPFRSADGPEAPPPSPREHALRAEVDRLRLDKQRLLAQRENADPFDPLLRPAREAWRAAWQLYYRARWYLRHGRPGRAGDDYAPYVLRPRQPALSSRRRILHVIGNFHTGGSARLIVDLIEHLGHRYEQPVLVRSLPPRPAYLGVTLVHRPRLWRAGQVSALLRRLRPDLVHVHMLGHQHDEYGRRDWSWYHKVMVALERHGAPVIENLNIPVEPYVSDVVQAYVHVSDFVSDRFGRVDARNETIHPGSDLAFFARRADQPVADDCIGMVYRLQPDKLDEAAIEPFIRVVRRRPATRVLIVGGGQFLEAYQRRVDRAGVREAFTFTGYVPYADLPRHLARMSLFVAPVHTESFGQVSPFAMGLGLPVVGYDVGALEEITGDAALLAPPGDADRLADIIIRLLDDRPRRLQIGERNRRRAEAMFSVETMAARYDALYAEILEAPRRRARRPLRPRPAAERRTAAAPARSGPPVTVLMSVFNGQRYLREAVESILGQTFEDFELLVVNDGSTDASRAILDSYRDPRLRIVQHATNLGLSRSLNRGIAQARGRYVARLDADDVAEPDRLQRQVDFLDRHPDVVLLGSCYTVIDEDGHRIGQRWVPVDDLEIRWMLEFCNAFAHSAVMLRRDALASEAVVYDESLVYAMDYDLWTRLAGRGRLANLDACLVRWRAAPGSLTSRLGDRTERFERVVASLRERLRWPVEDAGENERKAGLLCAIVAGATPDASIDEAEAAIGTLLDLHADFCRRHDVPAATRGVLRTGLVRHAARVLCWMGHQYPDHRTRSDARRALAAAGRLHPTSLLTSEGLRLALKILGGPPVVSLLRRLASRREARAATSKNVDGRTV